MTWKVVQGSQSAGSSSRAAPMEAQGKESMSHTKLVRVLVVDDEPSICKALSMALSRAGYDAIAAQSGESALAIVRNEHVDELFATQFPNDQACAGSIRDKPFVREEGEGFTNWSSAHS